MADVASAGHRVARVEIEADAVALGGAVRRLVSTGARSNPGSWESPATILGTGVVIVSPSCPR